MSSQETVPKDPAMTPSKHAAAEGSTPAEGEQSKKGAKKAEAKAKKEAERHERPQSEKQQRNKQQARRVAAKTYQTIAMAICRKIGVQKPSVYASKLSLRNILEKR